MTAVRPDRNPETSARVSPTLRGGESTDHDLLQQFLESPGPDAEDAFAAIVRRHGPMVLAICRRVLRSHQDAEDAFQATFVLLARKADTIRVRDVLYRWLQEVAFRTALRVRANAVQRQSHEQRGAELTAVAADAGSAGWDDARPVVQEEVRRLPPKYRTPVVLCYLEGRTNEEAARLLKWPIGTVKGRLSRARSLLRGRLERRGIVAGA